MFIRHTDWLAHNKRIPSVAILTATNGIMIDYCTFGSNTTSSGARITTFLIGARFVKRTVRVYSTFWSAGWGTSYIIWNTRAHSLAIDFSTLTIRPTRWRLARILSHLSYKSTILVPRFKRNFIFTNAYFVRGDIGPMHFLPFLGDIYT